MQKDIITSLLIGTLISTVCLVFGGFAIIEPQLLKAATATTSVTLTVSEEVSLTVSTSTTNSISHLIRS